MIEKLWETSKEVMHQVKCENTYLKNHIEEQKTEISSLKDKCTHMEELINCLKRYILNQEGENLNIKAVGAYLNKNLEFVDTRRT